jgi:hypothetical protein
MSDFKKLQVWRKAHALSLVMRDLQIIPKPTFDALTAQTITVRKMLYGLRRTLSDSTVSNRIDD